MKTKEEIRATTTGKIPRPANYQYGEKLKEWDDSLPAGSEHLLRRIKSLLNDRILVKLLDVPEPLNKLIVVSEKQLIGGMREAVVLKTGPGKWVGGEWWKVEPGSVPADVLLSDDNYEYTDGWWQWNPGYRRPVAVHPGQTVYIGNWVDLEADGLALCQEGDVRLYG